MAGESLKLTLVRMDDETLVWVVAMICAGMIIPKSVLSALMQ